MRSVLVAPGLTAIDLCTEDDEPPLNADEMKIAAGLKHFRWIIDMKVKRAK